LRQGPAASAGYKPSGVERWVRVEAIMDDGRTAWSQPFWLLPNAPRAQFSEGTLSGRTLPGARVHVSDGVNYLGNVVADDDGTFNFVSRELRGRAPDLWITATPRWPDAAESSPTHLAG
jgi:hypothetical protein